MAKKTEKPEVVCNCKPEDMSHIGDANDGQLIYFCKTHSKVRKLTNTEGK
jgi:hypothetical protein